MNDFLEEWKIRFRMYFLERKKIIVINPGWIQWEDKTCLARPYWPNKYSIEEMEEFKKELKESSQDDREV